MSYSPVIRYGLAVGLVAAALPLGLWLAPVTPAAGLLLLLAAVTAVAWLCGPGPALAASGLAVAGAAYFLLEPLYSIQVYAPAQLELTLFLLQATLISVLSGRAYPAQRRAVATSRLHDAGDPDPELEQAAGFQQREQALAEQLAQARAAQRRAEAANQLKDEFLAAAAHELRTPLNAILGWAQLLRSGAIDAANASRARDSIERNARAQAQLVDDILDVARIISGRLRLELRPLELGPVAEAAVSAVRPLAEDKHIQLDTALPATGVEVEGDPDRLRQVIWNLLSNAVKFTPAGGRIQLQLKRIGSYVELSVSDTGCGVAPPQLPTLFELFQPSDDGRRGKLRLGLTLARRLTELHGGAVYAASNGERQGATFTVRLPLRRQAPASASALTDLSDP